jgi:hypothetical protein
MYTRSWQVIKDDSKRTFEVCGQSDNTNAFTNEVYRMQRAGMNISGTTPPVSNKESHKDLVKISGYTKEEGLYKRLQLQYNQFVKKTYDDFQPDQTND